MGSVWIIIRKHNSRTVILTSSERLILSRKFWNEKNTKPDIEKKEMVLNLCTEFNKLMNNNNKKCLFTRKF
uniref:MOY n=1 Tax=Bactrocera latifrons TaxID=174628 RepID=A0A5B8HAG8_BACLA|nr:MOY [Bactrocera latifrons]